MNRMLLKLIFIVYNIICNKGGRRTVSHNCFISFKKEDAYYKDEISEATFLEKEEAAAEFGSTVTDSGKVIG